ncbi:hypothetical protein SEUBUCD646_0P00980 [Saccharomyces eubayanus]|nr:hypothetical protein SEUBUCD646_0P00980 [Saccharomyces eubayanus]
MSEENDNIEVQDVPSPEPSMGSDSNENESMNNINDDEQSESNDQEEEQEAEREEENEEQHELEDVNDEEEEEKEDAEGEEEDENEEGEEEEQGNGNSSAELDSSSEDDDDEEEEDAEEESDKPKDDQAESTSMNGPNEELQTEQTGADTAGNEVSGEENENTQSVNMENVNYELLQKQVKYIMDSNMLNLPQFQHLPHDKKMSAILAMLNSNSDTALFSPVQEAPVATAGTMAPAPTGSAKNIDQRKPPLSDAQRRMRLPRADLSKPITEEEHDRYTAYLHGENKITEMHNIPPKSRLFIGNLPLKNVSKEDLFRIFSPYGHIMQINIKNAFGFIQFDNPLSVRDAIECESQEMNFGKKLILEVSSSNARPQFDHGDHGTNSSSTFISSAKRPFQTESADIYNDDNGANFKKSKRHTPSCVIYVKRTADRTYASEVFNRFRDGTGLETDMIFLKPRMELGKMINDVAYDGVWGVVLVNKTHNVDVQTFYRGSQGETKFDEYISISAEDAVAIFNNIKNNRNSSRPTDYRAMNHQQNVYGAPPLPVPTAPAVVPPPQPNYYQNYGMPPPQQQQQQQPYGQSYGMPPPSHDQGYAAQAQIPINQNYGRYQSSVSAPPPPQQQQMPQGYGRYQGAPPPQPSSQTPMDQQQLLSAIQNLPPNVVSNLLSMAQQQQQQPHAQQQLVGLIQSMQGQAPQQQQQQLGGYASMNPSPPPMNNYNGQNMSAKSPVPPMPHQGQPLQQPPQQQQQQQQQQQPPHQQQPPQQQHHQQPAGNNVQSLLDSLAKLQK